VVALAAVYFIAGKLGLRLAFVNQSATAVWPATGIALAALLSLGLWTWPGVLLGAFLVNLTTAGTVVTSLGIAAGNTLEAVVGAYLISRFAAGRRAFDRPQDVFKFVALGCALPSAIAASIGVATLVLGGLTTSAALQKTWLTWWLGDTAGGMVVAPLILCWAAVPGVAWRGRQWGEAVALLATMFGVGLFIFGGSSPIGSHHYPLQSVGIPVLLWSAFRFTQRETNTLIVVLSAIAIWGTLRGFGPFGNYAPVESLLLLQGFVALISLTMLAAGASVVESRRTQAFVAQINTALEQRLVDRTGRLWSAREDLSVIAREHARSTAELERTEARLREAQSVARIGSWEWDIQHNVVWWSDALYSIYGVDREGFGASYETYLDRVHPDDRVRVSGIISRALENRESFQFEHRIVRPDGDVLTLHARGRVQTDEHGQPIRMLGVGLDVTERKRAEQEHELLSTERSARRQAEDANQQKDEFLATLSHELRNPLNVIVVWTHLLRTGKLSVEDEARALDLIDGSAALQNQLVLDLLDVSRITTGAFTLRRRHVDLTTLVNGAVDAHRPMATRQRVVLEAQVPAETLPAFADSERMQQVLGNLLSNALRFTPASGHVTVRLARVNGTAEICVQDDGPGIEPEMLPHVFDRFRRGRESRNGRHDGLGLGLAIVKTVAELHGGAVSAANRRDGPGAEFSVTVPIAATEAVGTEPVRSGAAS
jgi:PAS domain S-box-containing protein